VECQSSADGILFCKNRKNQQDCTTSDELVGKAKSTPGERKFAENRYFLLTENELVDRAAMTCMEIG
jgi:hypothetical protein